jgi:hypothetical protein
MKEENKVRGKSDEQFMGYQDFGGGGAADGGEIRTRQMSCMIKDLPQDEVPEFWKQMAQSSAQRVTIKQIVEKVTFIMFKSLQDSEDESLRKYKQALLGDSAQ